MGRFQEDTDFAGLYRYLETESLQPGTYSVRVFIVSSSDYDGVSVQQRILELIRRTSCGIDFSFVACLADNDTGPAALG